MAALINKNTSSCLHHTTTHPNPKRKKKEQQINWNWVWAQNNVGIKEKVVNGRPFFWQKTSGQMLREARQHQTHQNLFLRSKRRSMFDLVLYPTYPKSFKAIYHTRNLGARWAPISSWWPSATLLALRACLCNKTYLSRPSGTQAVFCCMWREVGKKRDGTEEFRSIGLGQKF